MRTSTKGIAYLESREGVVLKAYRDAAGVWTIGAGLTAASGVIRPKAGMTITLATARELLATALKRNYEPRVARAMPGAMQHEFDGGTSFDFNTGAIHRASWVKKWRAHASADAIRVAIGLWRKAEGKVLPGLERRRKEEANIILYDHWPADLNLGVAIKPYDEFARFVISVTPEEIGRIRDGFRQVGFDPGETAGKVLRTAVEGFQKKYGLTVDGLIGKATLSTLQRELDGRAAAKKAGTTAAGGAGVAAGNEAAAPSAPVDHPLLGDPFVTWLAVGVGAVALLVALYLAWHYRDLIAARVQHRLPRLAAWLRSF